MQQLTGSSTVATSRAPYGESSSSASSSSFFDFLDFSLFSDFSILFDFFRLFVSSVVCPSLLVFLFFSTLLLSSPF